jgi:hypothetical protein
LPAKRDARAHISNQAPVSLLLSNYAPPHRRKRLAWRAPDKDWKADGEKADSLLLVVLLSNLSFEELENVRETSKNLPRQVGRRRVLVSLEQFGSAMPAQTDRRPHDLA